MDMADNKIEFTGKIAKFPKNTKAATALKFLENIRVNPSKLWYIIVEDQGTDLKMVKYNRAQGVNLAEYTSELKTHYLLEYKDHAAVLKGIADIEVVGEDDFSVIKNVPNIVLESGQTLISKITTDLIKLLAS
jgi:hypothetical protein